MHDVQRDRQFSQKDQDLPGLGEKRFAMIVDSETQEILVDTTDNWRLSGDILLRPNSKKDLHGNLKASLTLLLRSPSTYGSHRK